MAKKFHKKPKVTKQLAPKETQPIVIQELRVQSADRSRKDIRDFKMALIGAESVTRPNRARLYDLYEDIKLDGYLEGLISKRISAVLNKGLFWEGKDKSKDENFDTLIESQEFRDVITQIIEVKLWGISGMEFIPGPNLKMAPIPRKHIKPHNKVIATMQTGTEGINYDGVSNLWVVGKENDLGLLLKCSPYAIWKRGAMADYSQYIEIFGQPVRIVKYDGNDTKTKQEVQQVLDESGSSLALMIPKQADFEMMDGKGVNGTGELQDRFRIACNEEMSIIVLGNTETTSSSSSSGYAQSKTHSEQQLEITKDDMMFVRSMINSEHFKNILKSYGFNTENGSFQFDEEVNLDEVKAKVEIATMIADKVPIADEQWYEIAGMQKPDNYEQLIKQKLELQETNKALLEASKKAQPNDDDDNTTNTSDKPTDQKQTAKEAKLSSVQKLAAYLADFFDHAHSK